MRPRLLDLFCGAGGAARGYQKAGFYVVGIDHAPQPRYAGDEFIQADALAYVAAHGSEFDAIHASPPCQRFSSITPDPSRHPNLIPETREALLATGLPYVIENVPGAAKQLINPIMLCGTTFELNVIRHRYFELSWEWEGLLMPCSHYKKVVKHGRPPDRNRHYAGVTGHMSDVDFARMSMGIDWMTGEELREAIPPAYTAYIGQQLMRHVLALAEAEAS